MCLGANMKMRKLNNDQAEELKRELRTAAMGGPGQPPIDLTAPDNKYSVWFRNGAQGFLCQGTGPYPAAAWALIGQYQLYHAVILEVADAGDRLTVVESCVG